MASTPEVALNSEGGKATQTEYRYGGGSPAMFKGFPGAEFALRLLLFANTLIAMVVLVTSKQTVSIPFPVPSQPNLIIHITRSAKFSDSPAIIYLLVALVVTTLYSIISLLISATSLGSKPSPSSSKLFKLLVFDLLMGGIMATATGSAAAVAYIGQKGNSHVMWNKICNYFDKFCHHIGSSTALSLAATIILLLLVLLSSFTIYRRSR